MVVDSGESDSWEVDGIFLLDGGDFLVMVLFVVCSIFVAGHFSLDNAG